MQVPGAHIDAVGGSPGALEWGAVSVRSLLLAKVEGKKGEKARRDVDASRGRMAACYVHAEGLRAVPQDCGKVSGLRCPRITQGARVGELEPKLTSLGVGS